MWNIGNIYYGMGEEVDFFTKFSYGALKMLPLILVSYIVGLSVEFCSLFTEDIKLMKVI